MCLTNIFINDNICYVKTNTNLRLNNNTFGILFFAKKEKYQRKKNSILFFYIFISFLLNCVGKRKETKQRKENRRKDYNRGIRPCVFLEQVYTGSGRSSDSVALLKQDLTINNKRPLMLQRGLCFKVLQ